MNSSPSCCERSAIWYRESMVCFSTSLNAPVSVTVCMYVCVYVCKYMYVCMDVMYTTHKQQKHHKSHICRNDTHTHREGQQTYNSLFWDRSLPLSIIYNDIHIHTHTHTAHTYTHTPHTFSYNNIEVNIQSQILTLICRFLFYRHTHTHRIVS